jgi:hypothetical protein
MVFLKYHIILLIAIQYGRHSHLPQNLATEKKINSNHSIDDLSSHLTTYLKPIVLKKNEYNFVLWQE